MQGLDRRAIEVYGIPALILMENAGRAVADEAIKSLHSGHLSDVTVLCGPGNNGGDGLVAARHLFNHRIKVKIFYFGNIKKALTRGGETGTNLNIALKMKIPVRQVQISECRMRDLKSVPHGMVATIISRLSSGLIIDALFGIGLNRPLEEPFLTLINGINALKRPVVAVDIPSGLDADKGVPLGAAIIATKTITLAAPKTGLAKPSARRYVGQLIVADIGIPNFLVKS